MEVKSGTKMKYLRAMLADGIAHIKSCPLCMGKGFVCELCDDQDIIYPFESNKVSTCRGESVTAVVGECVVNGVSVHRLSVLFPQGLLLSHLSMSSLPPDASQVCVVGLCECVCVCMRACVCVYWFLLATQFCFAG